MTKIKALITDFDNTLFDWFEFWYYSFKALLEEVERISGIDQDLLLPEIRKIHQKFRTSEYSQLLQELKIVHKDGESVKIRFQSAFNRYREERGKHLKLYPTVSTTLKELKKKGVTIAIYTESQSYYSETRLILLKLDGIVDYIFSPQEPFNHKGGFVSKLEKTKHIFLAPKDVKPNPNVLRDIMLKIDVDHTEAIYVGDSLFKDIHMANEAGVPSLHAKYGMKHQQEEYELLKKVSHWSDQDIKKEKLSTKENIKATVTLENGFHEILDHFKF